MTTALARLGFPPIAIRLTAAVATPAGLYAVGLIAGLLAASLVSYPTNEGSAYYVTVARNVATGRGLVIDTLWSYATPPLILPRPAFELWQPMASLIAALPMALLGTSFAAAQLGGILLGAAVAPLTWALARDAARALEVPANRIEVLAAGTGVLAAVGAPLLLGTAVPDSMLPFMVFGTLACWLAPRAWAANRRPYAALALGGVLGLAYLSRHEAIYIGIAIVLGGLAASRARGASKLTGLWLGMAVVGGLVVVGPWLLRDMAVFGTPLPGQALDNALLTSNEQIFAYGSRPTLAAFLAQGGATIVGNMVAAAAHNLIDVVLVMAMPVGLIGLLSSAFLFARRRAALARTGLWLLLVSGALTFVIASLVFPVASLWGTFQHAAGPLLVGLTVAAALGGDAMVDYVRRRRSWQRANAWLAPLALSLVAAAVAVLHMALLGADAPKTAARYEALAAAVAAQPEVAGGGRPVVISDRPIWLSDATGLSTLALPAEAPEVVLRLASDQHAQLIVLSEGRGDYPTAFRSGPLASCFMERPVPASVPGSAIFAIDERCSR